jgi:hypothetical protein
MPKEITEYLILPITRCLKVDWLLFPLLFDWSIFLFLFDLLIVAPYLIRSPARSFSWLGRAWV